MVKEDCGSLKCLGANSRADSALEILQGTQVYTKALKQIP